VLLGSTLARASLQARLEERDAAIEVNTLALAPGGEYADAHSIVEHCAPATRSAERFRAAAGKGGRCVFNGRVIVHPDAAGSDSQQSSRGLLLAPGAEIDSRPQLEIHTDDVKCSHGATTGRLDPDMLFYLLSRGLDAETARALLIFAFLDDVVARMGLDAIRRHLESRIAAALPQAPVIREFL
jgi:Fe-S cluster assembly protein SufD